MKKFIVLTFSIFSFCQSSVPLTGPLIGPDFLIIGVTKCGTTSLYKWMTEHPNIHGRKTKEIHYFDHNYGRGNLWYSKHFSSKKVSQLSGEATPGYFWKHGCVERIARWCPSSKLILICRNPVKRTISEYFRLRRLGQERLPFDQAIKRKKTFRRYIGASCYSEHLTQWLKHYPRSQMHIMFLEELAKNPEEELNKIFRFLGLKDFKLKSYEVKNKASYDMSKIKPETISFLEEFYKPYNKKLEKLLKRKLPWQ